MTSIAKGTRRGQTTIPCEIRKKYSSKEGDDIVISDEGGKVVLRHIPRLEDLAGADSQFGKLADVKKEIDRMRENY